MNSCWLDQCVESSTKMLILATFSCSSLVAGELGVFPVALGGGGTSAGGSFAVSGKVGEPTHADTVLSGGGFTVSGGFATVIAIVPMPGAPKLTLKQTSTGYEISWPLPAEGFLLQETPTLGSGGASAWTNSIVTPTDESDRRVVTLPANGPRRFFRLNKSAP